MAYFFGACGRPSATDSLCFRRWCAYHDILVGSCIQGQSTRRFASYRRSRFRSRCCFLRLSCLFAFHLPSVPLKLKASNMMMRSLRDFTSSSSDMSKVCIVQLTSTQSIDVFFQVPHFIADLIPTVALNFAMSTSTTFIHCPDTLDNFNLITVSCSFVLDSVYFKDYTGFSSTIASLIRTLWLNASASSYSPFCRRAYRVQMKGLSCVLFQAYAFG